MNSDFDDFKNPYASPKAGASEEYEGLPPLSHGRMDVGDVINDTWEIYKANFGIVFGSVFISGILNQLVTAPLQVLPSLLEIVDRDMIPVIIVMMAVVYVAAILFGVWIGIGQGIILLRVARGESTGIADLFAGGPYFLSVMGWWILLYLLLVPGFLLLIIPGILILLALWPGFGMIIDRRMPLIGIPIRAEGLNRPD